MPRRQQDSHNDLEPSQLDRNPQSGTSGLGRQQVVDIQRARMLAAMAEEVAERGAGKVSVAHVVARSGVSRRTFYEIFADREDCFLAAFDEAVTRVAAVVVPAYEGPGPWRAKIRAALTTLLELLDYDPGTGRLLIVESLGAGPKALERRGRVLARIVAAIDRGRAASKTEPPLPLTAEGLAGGVLSVLHGRLSAERPGSLIELTGPLTGMIVMPYLGAAAARREIERPTPKSHLRTRAVRSDPLRDLEMRLTYRTVRTLMAVAELGQDGSYPSNRAIGAGAGIPDQGQISKLLARLHKLGLVENTSNGAARGGPNAWTLTARGWEIHAAIAERTSSD
jgi:AcrR family transcriptional regulator